MNTLEETKFVQLICKHLDRSVTEMDAEICQRLDASRRQALLTGRGSPLADEELIVDGYINALDEQATLPQHIEQKLNAARQQALAQLESRAGSSPFTALRNRLQQLFETNLLMPASAFATACVMITMVSLFYANQSADNTTLLDEELVLIASAEDLELYENLDFYLWLEENGFPN